MSHPVPGSVRSDAFGGVTLADGPALLTYDAMWPRKLFGNHVRGFARKLPALVRSLFPSTQGIWAPPAAPARRG